MIFFFIFAYSILRAIPIIIVLCFNFNPLDPTNFLELSVAFGETGNRREFDINISDSSME